MQYDWTGTHCGPESIQKKTMTNRRNTSNLVEELKRLLERDTDILFAYLYGSSVNHPDLFDSDIDIGAYLRPGDLNEYVKKEDQLGSFLASQLHTDRIDLRIINALPLLLNLNPA